MLLTFSFSCSACKARLKAPLQIIGRWRTCPNCGHRFVVPAKPIPDSGPRLIFDDRAATSSRLFR
jgi:DNA-directed RNA polymerase subunit RPC12/RpoP